MNPSPDIAAAVLARVAGADPGDVTVLAGGASDRWYMRAAGPLASRYDGASVVVMGIAPELWGTFESFLANRRYLERQGVPVPAVFAEWRAEGIVLLEDFGDLTVLAAVNDAPARAPALYERAIDLLARLHVCGLDPAAPCPAFSLAFDEEKYRFEYGFHLRKWLVAYHWEVRPTAAETAELDRAFDWLGRTLAEQPWVFTHRDYQSSNLMIRPDGSLGLIDFQDARLGLRQYDLASLAWDSYVPLDEGDRARIVAAYRLSTPAVATSSPAEWDRLLRVAAIQRKLHDAGAFVYTAAHRGKVHYLRWVPSAVRMATALMATVPELRGAGELLAGWAARRTDRAAVR